MEQLPGPPIEVDERVQSASLRDPVHKAQVHPGIVRLYNSFMVNLAELGDPKKKTIVS